MGARAGIALAVLAVIAVLLWDRDRLVDQLVIERSAVKTLQGAVASQNTAILGLQTKADTFEAQAAIRARHMLARRPPLPAGHGPAVMNAWLRETFTEISPSPSPSPSPARGEGIVSEARHAP